MNGLALAIIVSFIAIVAANIASHNVNEDAHRPVPSVVATSPDSAIVQRVGHDSLLVISERRNGKWRTCAYVGSNVLCAQ